MGGFGYGDSKLLAFHDKVSIKNKYLDRVRAHKAADSIRQGLSRGLDGKGHYCAVACTLNEYNHKYYESELGIYQGIAILEDVLFENLPKLEAKDLPLEFLECIPVGADLSHILPTYLKWLLERFNDLEDDFNHSRSRRERERARFGDSPPMYALDSGRGLTGHERELNEISHIIRMSEPVARAARVSGLVARHSGKYENGVTFSEMKNQLLTLLGDSKKRILMPRNNLPVAEQIKQESRRILEREKFQDNQYEQFRGLIIDREDDFQPISGMPGYRELAVIQEQMIRAGVNFPREYTAGLAADFTSGSSFEFTVTSRPFLDNDDFIKALTEPPKKHKANKFVLADWT